LKLSGLTFGWGENPDACSDYFLKTNSRGYLDFRLNRPNVALAIRIDGSTHSLRLLQLRLRHICVKRKMDRNKVTKFHFRKFFFSNESEDYPSHGKNKYNN
jgi:hypothetical protein